uniref:Uncharacterized protein n=1 Tax=Anguilla anguilla TaxID=7936 RepID=A0A0E9QN14_ANGAN
MSLSNTEKQTPFQRWLYRVQTSLGS